ncbi:MAG: outer membrane lipoprotein carrier protein LolA [Elusimicrobiota bacterium]
MNGLIFGILLSLASFPAYAAGKAGSAPVKVPAAQTGKLDSSSHSQTGKNAVSTQAAGTPELFLYRSSAPLTLEAVVEHLKLYDKDLRSLSARFQQTVSLAQGLPPRTTEGTLEYLKPERLRIEHLRPEQQTLISDGKDLWVYRRSMNQALQTALQDAKRSDPALAHLLQVGDYSRWISAYSLALDASADGPVLTMRPKNNAQGSFLLKMTLSQAELFPQTLEFRSGDTMIRTRLLDIRFNPELQERSFRFTPPAGAEVFRDFKPPQIQ